MDDAERRERIDRLLRHAALAEELAAARRGDDLTSRMLDTALELRRQAAELEAAGKTGC